jgi:hypothetical protein
MQIGSRGFLLLTVSLGNEQNDLVFGECGFDCRERGGPPNQERNDYIWENDNIPKRQDRNPVRRRDALVVSLKNLWQL